MEAVKKFITKAKLWFKRSGFTNVAYLGIAVGAKLLLGSTLLFGAALGIFVYVNFNVIKKLVVEEVL